MRRIISLCCVALIFVFSLAAPAMASELESSSYIDILELSTANNSGTNTLPVYGSKNFVFNFAPGRVHLSYIDAVVFCGGKVPEITLIHDDGGTPNRLTVTAIGNGYYRVYGSLSNWYWSYLDFQVKFDNGTAYSGLCTFVSLKAYITSPKQTDIDAYCAINSVPYTGTIHYVPTDEINHRIIPAATSFEENFFIAYIHTDQWKKYDILNFQLMFDCFSITSISAVMGSDNVPIQVSPYEGTAIDGNTFFVNVTLDCSNLDRTADDYPMIIVMGRLNTTVTNSIDFVNCSGVIVASSISFISTLFNNILSAINLNFAALDSWIDSQTNSIVAALNGNTASGNDFKNESSGLISDLDGISQELEQVQRPSMSGINADLTPQIGQGGVLMGTLFSTFMSVPWVAPTITGGLIISLISYILYGKK